MVKRVSKRVSEIVFLIAAGGSTYYLIEIWDYRDQPFQLCGQICLPFMVMFSGLLCLAIVLGGVVLWGVYGEEKPEFHVL